MAKMPTGHFFFQFSEVLSTFLAYVNGLKFDEAPNYNRCRDWFKDALKKAKHPLVRIYS